MAQNESAGAIWECHFVRLKGSQSFAGTQIAMQQKLELVFVFGISVFKSWMPDFQNLARKSVPFTLILGGSQPSPNFVFVWFFQV